MKKREILKNQSPPLATYRFQFSSKMTLRQGMEWIPYLHSLGVSHCYASPLLHAKQGSTHGYDVVNHLDLHPEIGTFADFESFVHILHEHEMGLIFDSVPNHMYIADASNLWWNDVLENGPSSPYADYFDIDWHPPKMTLKNKVLLPLLEEQYGKALENQSIFVTYADEAFFVQTPARNLPTDPKSWGMILEPIVKDAEEILSFEASDLLELKSIITSAAHLPSMDVTKEESVAERKREKEVIKRRLSDLFSQNSVLQGILNNQLNQINGRKGDPESFDRLEKFLDAQSYRLCFWRVASDEINYRRFFDVCEFAGINTEKPEVFEAIHSLIFPLINQGLIDGLRIDHIDGLSDPEKFLSDLQNHVRALPLMQDQVNDFYTVAEKILTLNEKLRPEWFVDGTVGYDFLNQLNGLYVLHENRKIIYDIYQNFTGVNIAPGELIYECKKLILIVSMSSELSALSRKLERISEHHRNSRDFTGESLKTALRDVIAYFPVYRSYIRPQEQIIHAEDRQYILHAIGRARRQNAAMSGSVFDFLQNVLLLEHPDGLSEGQRVEREHFVKRFQQLTGPVMAKGVEDTAFYRCFPLASLNEVGNSPYSFSVHLADFHKKNKEREELWPHTMIATSTHDTKRSEDVRARINVLSEIPSEWESALLRWSALHGGLKIQDGDEMMPSANDEYLFYQTLIGTWPDGPMDATAFAAYLNRIANYMEKATKEAKIHTSWVNPNPAYDEAIRQFVFGALETGEKSQLFLQDLKVFATKIIHCGRLNSLSQIFLKFASPGVPDIFQGNEIWNLRLVDPDNRESVDFGGMQNLLESFSREKDLPRRDFIHELMASQEDGRIKLYLTKQMLRLRRQWREFFVEGTYVPLEIQGDKANHLIAFAKCIGNRPLVIIAGRFFSSFIDALVPSMDPLVWRGTYILIPETIRKPVFYNLLADEKTILQEVDGQSVLLAQEALVAFPFALLEGREE